MTVIRFAIVITAGKQFATVIIVGKQFGTVMTVGKQFATVITVAKVKVTSVLRCHLWPTVLSWLNVIDVICNQIKFTAHI